MAELKLDIEQRQTLERQLRFQLQEKKDEVGELCTRLNLSRLCTIKLNLCRLCTKLNLCRLQLQQKDGVEELCTKLNLSRLCTTKLNLCRGRGAMYYTKPLQTLALIKGNVNSTN